MNTLETRTRLHAALGDRFQIVRTIGEGESGTVYLARDLQQARDVAIKVLKSDVCVALGAERFLWEIQLAERLVHPNILPIVHAGDADGTLFYVMPNAEGRSLRADLDASGPLPVGDAIRVASEVASALDYAHRHGLVHRDLKPENILFREGHALVGDLGLGAALARIDDVGLARIGGVIGAPAYMSPEQMSGEPVDARSDIYSLACVLYEMLVGEPPFTGSAAHVAISKRFVHTPPSVAAVRDGIPRPVAHAIQRGLARSPADRPTSAAAFASSLLEADRISGPVSTQATLAAM
jgi:serine/threonine-protein kinase